MTKLHALGDSAGLNAVCLGQKLLRDLAPAADDNELAALSAGINHMILLNIERHETGQAGTAMSMMDQQVRWARYPLEQWVRQKVKETK